MSQESKLPFAARLAGIFIRSFVLTAARLLIMGWYVYFVVQAAPQLQGGGYMVLLMAVLSIFGLWQLLEVLAKALKLQDAKKADESGGVTT